MTRAKQHGPHEIDTSYDRVTPRFTNGWRSDLEQRNLLWGDHRPFTCMLDPAKDAPEEIDHRGWLQIENQGAEGSCAGHSTSSVLEVCNYIASGGGVVQLSRMFCYLSGQIAAGLIGSDQGCTIGGAIQGAKERGAPLESTFPYSGHYETDIPQPAIDEAVQHKLRSHSVLTSERDVFGFLAKGIGGVICGVPWNQSLASNDGVVETAHGKILGMHAIPLVGYSRRKDAAGRNYYWLPNSWGPTWGDKGWAEIAPAIVEYWIENGCVVIGASDLQSYGPRKIVSFRGMVG